MVQIPQLQKREPQTRASVNVVTPPTNDPITIEEAKRQLNIAASDEAHDERLADLIQEAVETWEADTHTKQITQTIEHIQELWENAIRLTYRPVQSIESVKYRDLDGNLVTVSAADYELDKSNNLVRFKRTYTLPNYLDEWNAWQVRYVAGWGSKSTDVPQLDRGAMLMLVAFKFETPDMLYSDAIYREERYANLVHKRMRATYP